MNTIIMILSIILFVVALALTAIVVVQTDRGSRMSAVTGNNGSGFYGKNKGTTKETIMKRATIVCAIVFTVLIIVLNILQGVL